MNQEDKYESLKAKLRKLAALAERGVGGEAENARRLMEQICLNFKRDVENLLETLFLSYCQKHSLFREKSGDEPEEEYQLTPEVIRKLIAAAALRDSLSDNSYCKLIER